MNQKTKTKNLKLITILGPTASGKTALSIKLALRLSSGQAKKRFHINGVEIISADSRQVYKGMDIGTAKITPDTNPALYAVCNYFPMPRGRDSTGQAKKKYIFTHQRIPHYCIDVASPKRRFSVARYKKLAEKALKKIWQKGKLPFLVGGTGFYIQAVVDDIVIPEVKPDWKLRKKLEKKTAKELFLMLKKMDPKRAKTIEKENKRRLIRALEIVIKTKKPVPQLIKKETSFRVLFLGIKKPADELKKLIKKRLLKRLKAGMLAEVKRLKNSGLSWKRLEEFGLEYRYCSQYLQKKISEQQMIERIQKESEHYVKRQLSWFKRDKRIKWIKNYKEAEGLIKRFI